MARVYARQIHEGKKTLATIPEKYREATIEAYHDIYGIWLDRDNKN